MFKFTKFVNKKSRYCAYVSIRMKGVIGFNTEAVRKYDIADHKFVAIYYDREKRVVGLQLLKEKDGLCFKITHSRKGHASIFGRSFFDKSNIEIKLSSYELKLDDTTGFLYFELNEPIKERNFIKERPKKPTPKGQRQ